jgi:hypothetical protein
MHPPLPFQGALRLRLLVRIGTFSLQGRIDMPLNEVDINRTYKMDDGRKLRITNQWPAENGHTRVRFEVIEGEASGFLDCSLTEFRAKAVREVPAA